MDTMGFVYVSFLFGLLFSIVWNSTNFPNVTFKIGFIVYTLWAGLIILERHVPLLFATVRG